MHLIVTGNPVDGFIYHGIFANVEAAVSFAEKEIDSGDWWVAPMVLHTVPEEMISSKREKGISSTANSSTAR